MTQAFGIPLAMLIGVSAAIQVSLLGAMGRQRGAVEATWVSILGTVFLISLILGVQTIRGVALDLPPIFTTWVTFGLLVVGSGVLLALAVSGLPAYFAVTGFFAAPLIFGASFLVPRLGIGLFLGSVIAGQLLGGLTVDHIGAFGVETRPIDLMRVVGVGVLLVGVMLIRGFR